MDALQWLPPGYSPYPTVTPPEGEHVVLCKRADGAWQGPCRDTFRGGFAKDGPTGWHVYAWRARTKRDAHIPERKP